MVLARDDGVCHYCGGMADTVDHVTCIADGGARLDPADLVAACRPCNSRRSAERTNRRRSMAPQSRKW
jgi:5-methylcytosine-specific restriction endonuclease McrA